MFFGFNSPAIRYTGRFAPLTKIFAKEPSAMCSTACGSYFEVAFKGNYIVLNFNTELLYHPRPHLYISVDGGAQIESIIEKYIRINLPDSGDHVATVILKSEVESQPRWYNPHIARIEFQGFEADAEGILPPDDRKTIEFVGDSITEGILIDPTHVEEKLDVHNRPLQDDSTASYAWLTSKALNLRPYIMGYGATGMTRSGSGSVPMCETAYPYCFEGQLKNFSCDYIVINHGANDRGKRDIYLENYEKALNVIRDLNKNSKIIILSPFVGAFDDVLPDFVKKYNEKYNDHIYYISSHGWVPDEPLHPLRDGHKIIAEHLTEELKKIID